MERKKSTIDPFSMIIIVLLIITLLQPISSPSIRGYTNTTSEVMSSAESKTEEIDVRKHRGNQPSDVVITPDGTRVYVTAMGTDNVFVIDTATNALIDRIPLSQEGFHGAWPFCVGITPDGSKIYVANMMSDNLCVVDTATNVVARTVELGHFVHDVAITPDGKLAYVDIGHNFVPVIDVATDSVVDAIHLNEDDLTYTVSSSHDGSRVFIGSQVNYGARVYVVDTSTNDIISCIELEKEITNQGILAVSPNDDKLYLPCGITSTTYADPTRGVNKIFVIDLVGGSVSEEIEIVGGPIAIQLSPDGQIAYVSTFAAQKIFVVNLSINTVVDEIFWDGILDDEEWRRSDLRDMAITSDGGNLYITAWDADAVLVADLITRRMTNIIDLNRIKARVYEVAITRDGTRVYISRQAVTSEGRSSLVVVDTKTNSVIDEIVGVGYPRNPYVTSDGQLLCLSGNRLVAIDTATNEIIREIFLGDWGYQSSGDIAVLPSQNKAYVTDELSRYVYVVDLASGTVIYTIDVGWWPKNGGSHS